MENNNEINNENNESKYKKIAVIAIIITVVVVVVMLILAIIGLLGNTTGARRRDIPREGNSVAAVSPSPSVKPSPTPYQKEDFDEHKGYITSIPDELGTLFINDIEDYYKPDELDFTIEAKNAIISDSVDNAYADYDIDYPEVTFKDGRDATEINEKIKEKAYECYNNAIEEISAGVDDGAEYTGTIDYQITYVSNSVMCVLYNENYTLGNIYLEYADLSSLVIDMQNGTVYNLWEVLGHDKAIDKLYYDKLITESPTLAECKKINLVVIGHTMESKTWVDNRYKTDFILTGGGITLAFTYHYNDGNRLARGWTTVNFTIDEMKKYFRSSDLWERFPE